MLQFAFALLVYVRTLLRSRHDLGMEILALRQQLAVFKRRHPRPRLKRRVTRNSPSLCSLWDRWTNALLIVNPESVVRWHRAEFSLYWHLRSYIPCLGRPRIEANVFDIVKRMARGNPSWGAPKIHGEQLKLGIEISERTVSRYLLRRTPSSADAAQRWWAFLNNHREAIVALDFFTLPTLTFRLLYCLFVIDHHRRRILHFNVTAHPTAKWVCQQLHEAFLEPSP